MSTVTVNIDHIPTHEITEERWVQIACSLLHSEDHATFTRREDVASLLVENGRLEKELAQARDDMDARWAGSDHLAAKYYRRMRAAEMAADRLKAEVSA